MKNYISALKNFVLNKASRPVLTTEQQNFQINDLGTFIQKNIRIFLNDKTQTKFELPKIQHDYISQMHLEIFEKDKQKSLILLAKAPERPEIGLQLAKGSYDDILACVDRYDFSEKLKKTIQQLSDTLPFA